MEITNELNLKPIDLYEFRINKRCYRGMSINKNGVITFSKMIERELKLEDDDMITFSTSSKRWFLTIEENGQYKLFRYTDSRRESYDRNLIARTGRYLTSSILLDLNLKSLNKPRIYLSIDRIPSNGKFWYEILSKDPLVK